MPPPVFAFALPIGLFLTFWVLCYKPLAGFINWVKASAKSGSAWFARSRFGKWGIRHSGLTAPYPRILLVVAVGGIAAFGAGRVFVELGEEVRLANSAVNGVDHAIHTWFGNEQQAAMTLLFSAMTSIGSMAGLGVIVAVVVAMLLAREDRASAIFVVVAAGGSALLNVGLKMMFARARPDLASALAVVRGYSFPSGHAMISFTTFGAFAYIVLRQNWPWLAKSAGLAIALTIVVLVGLSRVYMAVHWASDIAGAWSAGTVWLATSVVTYEMLLRSA